MIILLNSCGTVSNIIDYGISQWETYMPADSYDHTLIDAWRSGTGGKSLVIGEVTVGAFGELSGKDVSGIKRRIHNAAGNLTNNETFGKNDVNNLVGAFFTLGDEFIDEYNQQSFDDAVKRLTDPSASGYNEEEALRVSYIDYENRKIIWKSNREYLYDLIEYRKGLNESWISSNLDEVCGMSLEEYNNLPNDARQEIDIKILAYSKSKGSSESNRPKTPDLPNPIVHPDTIPHSSIDYTSLIDGLVISEYDINSFNLSQDQKEALDRIAEILNTDKTFKLLISGHTCTLGSENVNYSIGLKRADAAKEYLIESGIDGERISVESLGFSKPIDENSTETGRKHNRRLTFKILK